MILLSNQTCQTMSIGRGFFTQIFDCNKKVLLWIFFKSMEKFFEEHVRFGKNM